MGKHVKDKTVISLNPREYYRLQEVLMNGESDKALTFVKEVLGKKIKELERPRCVPVFEASYRPGQKDKFRGKK